MSFIEPTACSRGSTMEAAPCCRAATTPAPYRISPCVSVGPSSITRTRLPGTMAGSSTVTGLRALMTTADGLNEVVERLEPLDPLGDQVAVGHGVADDDGGLAVGLEDLDHLAGGLALARAGPDRAHGDDGDLRLEHGVVRAEQDPGGAGGHGCRRAVHDVLVGDVGVGEHDLVDVQVPDEIGQLVL